MMMSYRADHFWGHVNIISWSFWDHLGITLGSFWGHFLGACGERQLLRKRAPGFSGQESHLRSRKVTDSRGSPRRVLPGVVAWPLELARIAALSIFLIFQKFLEIRK